MRAYISTGGIKVQEILEVLRDDLRTLPEDLKSFSYNILTSKEVQSFILERNKALLEKGLRPDLTPIEKTPEADQKSNFYERRTIYERGEKGLQTGFVDLHDTGFFYSSLTVKASSEELLEFSTDPKAVELERVWGNILGISSEDINDLIFLIRPKIIKFVTDKLKFRK